MYKKNWSIINSEKCMATLNFLFGYQEHLLSSAFSAQFYCKPHKNFPVFVGTTHRKLDYLKMRSAYAQ